jgi:hypothetical protein
MLAAINMIVPSVLPIPAAVGKSCGKEKNKP